jgi:predicted polyphosphate/ATP-dependent NAD kinase
MQALALEGTPLGVDAVRDGVLVDADLDEAGLLNLLGDDVEATLVLGVIGGQGFLLGRGNQQISARVLRRIGESNVVIVAGAEKVSTLDPPVLHVDVGDGEREHVLEGYRQVRVAPERSIVLRVAAS